STTVRPSTASRVTPYLTHMRPPAFVAMLPPTVEIARLAGSGAHQRPCGASAAFNSALMTPASTTASSSAASISRMRVMRSVDTTSSPCWAMAPPASPVPAPRGTTGTPCALAQRSAACTWATSRASTRASGALPERCPDLSARSASSAAASVMSASPSSRRSSSSTSTSVASAVRDGSEGRVRNPLSEARTACESGAVAEESELFATRYRALASRDARFDGQFIAGVHSTGIYCRPSCPAVTPKPGNVTFYRTAAAAHEAGLRACKRCQPDAVPGSPDWNLRDDLAARAMRLVHDGVVEREGVAGLARRLGYSSRHLTRVLRAELGAGPLALARAHRAQTARTLLASTELRIADIAFAAGFGSLRQFNDTIAEIYRATPSELRRLSRRGRAGIAPEPALPGTLSLRLAARAPLDHVGLFRFFADHAIPGLEEGDAQRFARPLALPGGPATIEIRPDAGGGALVGTVRLSRLADIGVAVARIRRAFDLDADAVAIDAALAADPVLAPLAAATPGIRIAGSFDPAEALIRTLVGQQISVAAARTVLGR